MRKSNRAQSLQENGREGQASDWSVPCFLKRFLVLIDDNCGSIQSINFVSQALPSIKSARASTFFD